ncbi:MAG TPA: transposase [Gemmatimonadaceae bacterium]|nr:transposase [Gemmatimonadaceae bacterium]
MAVRGWCRAHRVRAVIVERDGQRERRAHRPGRKPHLDREQYRARHIVERVIGWLKNLRQIACRAEQLAVRCAGTVTLALIARTAGGLSDVGKGWAGFRDGGRFVPLCPYARFR